VPAIRLPGVSATPFYYNSPEKNLDIFSCRNHTK
jgi:hypothetical protein